VAFDGKYVYVNLTCFFFKENDLFLKELQFLHENKDTDHVFDFTAQVKRKMDRNSDVIHHKNDNYDSNNFPAGKTYISQSCILLLFL